MKTIGTITLAIASLFVSTVATAGTFVGTRAYYQGAPSDVGDINDTQYDFNPSATTHSNISLTADGGVRNADATAMLDVATGTFKGSVSASTSGAWGQRTAAWSDGWMGDVLRISSANATETVRFTISYESLMNTSPVSTSEYVTSSGFPIRHTDSEFGLSLWHDVANPDYVEGGEASATIRESLRGQNGRITNWVDFTRPELNGGNNVKYTYNEQFGGNALDSYTETVVGQKAYWAGTLSFEALLPTNTDINFETRFSLAAFCYQASSCLAANDSSHSFHFGVEALGGSLASQNGYLGLPTIPAVPEPETYAMLLAGLGLIAAKARRRSRQA